MSAVALIQFPARSEGRPSNAALQMEVRTLRNAVAVLTEERDDLADDLMVYVKERIAVATEMVALARRGQVLLAAGHRPVQPLLDIERLGHRESLRARSMGASGDAA